MIKYLGIALMILAGHVYAAGRSTLDEIPAPVRSMIVHAYLEDNDPDKYSEVFFEPTVIGKLSGAIVTLRVNNGKQVQQQEHRFFLPEAGARLCNVDGSILKHAVGQVVVEEQWQVAQPVEWNDSRAPNRIYGKEASTVDIIGTELCVAHFESFGDALQERTMTLMKERERQGKEDNAARQATHTADVATLKGCLQDREELKRTTDANNRRVQELNSTEDRLKITLAGLEIQRAIVESYEASATSRNNYTRQLQALRVAGAEHDRNAKALKRDLERHEADEDRWKATCARSFSGSAMREACRGSTSVLCTDNKEWR